MHLLRDPLPAADDRAAVVRLIGVGNWDRGDDAAGLLVARALRRRLPRSLACADECQGGPAMMDRWHGADLVIVVDAVSTGATPGTIYRLDAGARPLSILTRCRSSHALSVGEVIELARTLRRLPPRLIVYGIEGAQYALGAAPSPAVVRAVRVVAQRIRQELRP